MLPIAYNSDANLQTGVGRGGHHGKVLSTTKTLAFAGDTRDVGTAGGIPKRDVLLHALREASLFLGGDGRAGGGNAGVEAVLIHFSDQIPSIGHGSLLLELLDDGSLDLLRVGSSIGGAGTEQSHCADV